MPVQIIGIDPETDFLIRPWIEQSYSKTITDGDVIAGANINVPSDHYITFYGKNYKVVAQLAKTGTGLDSAVFTNRSTIKQMAEDAVVLLGTESLKGVNFSTAASAVMIRVADGYSITDVADDINIHVTKVDATASKNMIADISSGLGGVSRVIGILVAAVWVLAVVILAAVFAMVAAERKKEFAVLRIAGASRSMLVKILGAEAAIISGAGAILGLALAIPTVSILSGSLKAALGLPFLMPGVGKTAVFAACALLLSVLAGVASAMISARKLTGSDTGLLLREDE